MVSCKIGKSLKILGLFLIFSFFAQGAASQEDLGSDVVPDVLRRPDRGEAPRYPSDLVIGELGRGEASDGAYLFAQNLLSAITEDRRNAQIITESGFSLSDSVFDEIRSIRPRYYRIGGGRTEPDGYVSFLIRIIGSDESITGELFLRLSEASEDDEAVTVRWLLDDLILESKRTLAEIRDSYRYDFSPYERFF